MNILILNWRDPYNPRSGGAEYVTQEHAKRWVKYGDSVTWFSACIHHAKAQERIDGVNVIRRGTSGSVFFYAMMYYFRHRKGIDVIVDQVHGIPFFTVLYVRTPLVLFIHEIAGPIWHSMYAAPISWIGRIMESWYIRLYRGYNIWTDASSTVDELVAVGVARSDCSAIPCPISNIPRASSPQKQRSLTCIFVGRIVRMKRVEDVIDAFYEIRKQLQTAMLWIVGDGDRSYITWLKQYAGRLGIADQISWYGRVTEAKKLATMAKAHILLHASIKEGWGLVVLEAGSQWTPSVVYPVSGLVDTVKHGVTGIVTQTQSPQELARATVQLYRDTAVYRQMQKQAVRWSTMLQWDDAAHESRALLRKAYGKKR